MWEALTMIERPFHIGLIGLPVQIQDVFLNWHIYGWEDGNEMRYTIAQRMDLKLRVRNDFQWGGELPVEPFNNKKDVRRESM